MTLIFLRQQDKIIVHINVHKVSLLNLLAFMCVYLPSYGFEVDTFITNIV